MRNSVQTLLLFVAVLYLAACGSDKEKTGRIIADRIEYPVFIKSPYGEEDGCYWKENLETSKRQDFVKTLFEWAYSGKVKAFDYVTNQPLTAEQVKVIGNESDTITAVRPTPPYDEFDTVIQTKLNLNLIHKVKILEEWRFNTEKYTIEKKLLGIAPTLTVYADSNEIKGYRPLFWIYFDKDYVSKLAEKEKDQ